MKMAEQCYDSMANEYDMLMRNSQFYSNLHESEMEVLRRVIKSQKHGLALDIGCGTGDFALEMAKGGFDTLAIDLSDKMLAKARSKSTELGVHLALKNMNALDVGNLKNQYSIVTAFGSVINHLDNWPKLFRDISNRMIPGGKLLVSIDNLLGVDSLTWGLYKGFLGKNNLAINDLAKRRNCNARKEPHRNEWTFKTLSKNLSVHLVYYPVNSVIKWMTDSNLRLQDAKGANITSTFDPRILDTCFDLTMSRVRFSPISKITSRLDKHLSRILWNKGGNIILVAVKA
jgi:SAM-dependent methyltransferase